MHKWIWDGKRARIPGRMEPASFQYKLFGIFARLQYIFTTSIREIGCKGESYMHKTLYKCWGKAKRIMGVDGPLWNHVDLEEFAKIKYFGKTEV